MKPGFLCTRVLWRGRYKEKDIHLKPLNNAGSKDAMCFTGTVAITYGDSA